MTQQEAIKELDELPSDGDTEDQHLRADRIILTRLKQWESATVKAYEDARERCGFWYA